MRKGSLAKDLTGMKFDRLTIIGFSCRKNKAVYWNCKCDCGGFKEVQTGRLTGGHVRSCGCLLKSSFKDISGQKFNRLTAISFHSMNSAKNRVWLFRCDCGKEFTAEYSDATRGKVKSCGCLTIISAKKPKSEYSSPINNKYNGYKFRAKKTNIPFKLTKDQFVELVKSPCHYCGEEPSQYRFDHTRNNGELLNGVDKVDNDKGYVIENCVPCCTVCNLAKRNLNVDLFIKWVKRISDHLKSKELI